MMKSGEFSAGGRGNQEGGHLGSAGSLVQLKEKKLDLDMKLKDRSTLTQLNLVTI